MIYFIQQGVSGPIKIGYTKNVTNRMPSLQTGSAHKLHLLGAIEGDKNKEHTLQNFFREDKMQGEWFKPSAKIMNFILSLIVGTKLHDIKTSNLDATLRTIEINIISKVMSQCNNSQTKAADAMNISVRSLRHRIKKYKIST